MRALVRLAAVAVAGAALYYAGIVNSMVIYEPSRIGAILVVAAIAAALGLMALALRGDGRGDAAVVVSGDLARPLAAIWLVVALMALVSLGWIYGVPRSRGFDWTPYHNDAIALNECAAETILAGANPYRSLDLFACYGERRIGPDRTTPLRRGMFADVPVYPTDEQLDAAWAARSSGEGENVEFVWRPSYPALSFVLIAPWVALGWDTNVLYLLCLLVTMGLVLWRAAASLRAFLLTGLLGATSLVAFTVGGSSDVLYALPLAVAWLWRDRSWSAVAYGLAAAVKQIAWFFAPFLFIQWVARHGWSVALRRAAVSAAVFAGVNAPWILADAPSWLAGVLTPIVEPMFPRGAGLVFLGINDVGPLAPSAVYLALELAAAAAALALAWRSRHTDPELGAVLAAMPLFFAHRSLFSYFFLLPLFAFAGLARMPLGQLTSVAARSAGALTVFALPDARASARRRSAD